MKFTKKLTALLIALTMALALTACQDVEAETVELSPTPTAAGPAATTEPAAEPTAEPQAIKYTVNSGDAWGDYGYVHFLCEQSGTYSFKAIDSGEIGWKVYILDAEFDDAERFIPQAHECALEGDGTLEVAQGQYIYIYCTANNWTGIEASEQANYECTLTAQ